MSKISLVTILKNEERYISIFLDKLIWIKEIILVNNLSSDKTINIIEENFKNINLYESKNIKYGKLKNFALSKATKEWILMLDVDEIVSEELKKEIIKRINSKSDCVAYKIRYQNYFLGHPLKCRAQQYYKARLFKRGYGRVSDVPIHEEMIINGKVGVIEEPIHHYSFRTIPQTLKKFSYYASIEAPLLFKKGERTNLKKLTMYPAHMFYAIFFKDEGYKDGIWGFGLAVCFAIMEFLKYWYLLRIQIKNRKIATSPPAGGSSQ